MNISDFILGYSAGQSGGGSDPVLEPVTVTPSTTQQVISPPEGADGISQATVSAVTKELLAQLDADFVAGNIKKDVDLFGLVGTFAGGAEFPIKAWTYTPTSEFDENTKIIDNDPFIAQYGASDNIRVLMFSGTRTSDYERCFFYKQNEPFNEAIDKYGVGLYVYSRFYNDSSNTPLYGGTNGLYVKTDEPGSLYAEASELKHITPQTYTIVAFVLGE